MDRIIPAVIIQVKRADTALRSVYRREHDQHQQSKHTSVSERGRRDEGRFADGNSLQIDFFIAFLAFFWTAEDKSIYCFPLNSLHLLLSLIIVSYMEIKADFYQNFKSLFVFALA